MYQVLDVAAILLERRAFCQGQKEKEAAKSVDIQSNVRLEKKQISA